MICITDTGIGIPQDKQEFVFERFAKLDTFSKGTGLGLALSRLIMEGWVVILHLMPNIWMGVALY